MRAFAVLLYCLLCGCATAGIVLVTGGSGPVADTSAPTPNPATFATPPTTTGPYSMTMTATQASDTSEPVEYYFACTVGGGADSTWTEERIYNATGLSPDTLYTWTVTYRDALGNTGTASSGASDTTDTVPTGNIWYFDPVGGDNGNTGTTAEDAWGAFCTAFSSKIQRRAYDNGALNETNPVAPGDTCYLMDGYHGYLPQTYGYFNNAPDTNDSEADRTACTTVIAYPGDAPTIGSIAIGGFSGWRFENLTIQYSLMGILPAQTQNAFYIKKAPLFGEDANLAVVGCNISSCSKNEWDAIEYADELQTITPDDAASAGTWTWTWAGKTTAPMAYNITLANMQTAMRLLRDNDDDMFSSITVTSVSDPPLPSGAAIVVNFSTWGDVAMCEIDFDGMTGPTTIGTTIVETVKGVNNWDWMVKSGINGGSINFLVEDCNIMYVYNGINPGGENAVVRNNEVKWFGSGGISIGNGNNQIYEGNYVNHSIRMSQIHIDLMQRNDLVSFENITIRNNTLICYDSKTEHAQTGTSQGIFIQATDTVTNWEIYNNVIVVDASSALFFDRCPAMNCRIYNNIAIEHPDPLVDRSPEIGFDEGTTNCVIKNNIGTVVMNAQTGLISANNIDFEESGYSLSQIFLNAANLDLTHAVGSPALNAGDDAYAPATDILGNSRVGTSDIGAYEKQ